MTRLAEMRLGIGEAAKQLVWWVFFSVCAFYSLFAFYMGGLEVLSLLDMAVDAPHRAAPVAFVVHAWAGGVALLSGILQLNRRLLNKRRAIHRALGRVYVWAIWLSSATGLWSAAFFDVNLAAKFVFGALSVLWFGTTTIAFRHIRNRRIAEHREWMIRSFSLSLFSVTFSLWVPGLASTSLPAVVGYPLAVFLSWSLNLLIAELWIRHTRPKWRASIHGDYISSEALSD